MADTADHEGGPITVASIEAKLAAGTPVDPADVAWLLQALKVATADEGTPGEATPGPDETAGPSREQLIAEFKLGPDPSPDMLAYLADYVAERAAAAAADADEDA